MDADAPMTPIRATPDRITRLAPNEVFVFGSNTRGRMGSGAAKDALSFGAREGCGEGRYGQTYALPTKGFVSGHLVTLELIQIACAAKRFLRYAVAHPELTFLLTPVGCGLAGLSPSQVAPLFMGAPPNVVMPTSFLPYLS